MKASTFLLKQKKIRVTGTFTIDLGYKLSKLEGQSEVVEEVWCETCRHFSSDHSSLVDDLIQYL